MSKFSFHEDDFQENINRFKTSHDLLRSIEANPRCSDLVERAKNPKKQNRKYGNETQGTINKILKTLGIVVDPKDLHGNSFVSENLARTARITARVVIVSAVINCTFTLPLLYYIFSFLGFLPSCVASFISNCGLAAFSNNTATLTATRSKDNSVVSVISGTGFLAVASVLTVASAVGAELFSNQAELATIVASEKATVFVDETHQLLNDVPYKSKLDAAKSQCEENLGQLALLPEGSIERNDLFRRTWGGWNTYEQYFLSASGSNTYVQSISPENAASKPICVQEAVYQKAVNDSTREIEAELSQLQRRRTQLGNDVKFLKTEASDIHDQLFTSEGYLKDGALAVKVALDNLVTKLQEGRWNELGFSIFLLSISAITSSIACLLTFSLAALKDAEKAACPVVREEILSSLKDIEDSLLAKQDYERSLLNFRNHKRNTQEEKND